jgi:glucose-6-phosphate isomerase
MEISFDDGRTRSKLLQMQGGAVLPYVATVKSTLINNNYFAPEASVNLPSDASVVEAVETVVRQVDTAKLRYVFLVGIGGSYLGAKAVYDALYSMRDMTLHSETRLVCVDTNNRALLRAVEQIIATLTTPEEYFVVVASKSGGTTETIANAEIILHMCDERWPKRADRVCVVGDEGSALIDAGKELGMYVLTLPQKVGGRYSVFSAVGLLPLALCGVDIRSFLAGAEAMLGGGTHADPMLNPASASAVVRAYEYQSGKNIHDWFTFSGQLASLGGWWRQLVGESIGKTVDGVAYGITPTVSVGSNDLHSVGQLYFGGPKDKYLTFVTVKQMDKNYIVPTARVFPKLVSMVKGVSVEEIMSAIVRGTKEACRARQVPFMSVTLEEVSPYELGAFMQFAMLETIYLGKLLGINPFDQPDVEAYKSITKEILETKQSTNK